MRHVIHDMFEEQRQFNLSLFEHPKTVEAKSQLTKEMSLHLISEVDELLRQTAWKFHRKEKKELNIAQIKNELSDILKYWITLCLIWDVDERSAVEDFWRKSMVVHQRFSQEYVQKLNGPIALVDIDGVLADYFNGFLDFLESQIPDVPMKNFSRKKEWFINYDSLGIPFEKFQEIKHKFNSTGQWTKLPVYSYAKPLLDKCRALGLKIVMLTSRPIDRYPNIYTETLEWLKINNLPFDSVWWSTSKEEFILSNDLKSRITDYFEDDYRYVQKVSKLGIRTLWIDRFNAHEHTNVNEYTTVMTPKQMEDRYGSQKTQTNR